ncbi:hypothetical protein EJB05_35665, partial [Eragrostis curvula]
MTETGAIVLSAAVGLLGVASTVLGFVAKATKLTHLEIFLISLMRRDRMRTGEIVVSVAVGILGVASAVLGIIAEATKLTPNDIEVSRTQCVHPANPAFELALCALLLLLVAQIIHTAAGGCCGCCRPRTGASQPKRVGGIVASVLSWIAALSAGALYLQGTVLNAPLTHNVFADGCYYLKGGVFTRAAVLSLVASAFGILSYFLLTRTQAQAPAPAATPTTAAAIRAEPKPGGP